jgi:hypothetical protein
MKVNEQEFLALVDKVNSGGEINEAEKSYLIGLPTVWFFVFCRAIHEKAYDYAISVEGNWIYHLLHEYRKKIWSTGKKVDGSYVGDTELFKGVYEIEKRLNIPLSRWLNRE